MRIVGLLKWTSFGNSTQAAHVEQVKKGEQVPFSSIAEDVTCSSQQSSNWQQGINEPLTATNSNIQTSLFFIECKGSFGYLKMKIKTVLLLQLNE